MTADPPATWPAGLVADMNASRFNGVVGSVLESETDRARAWHLHLPTALYYARERVEDAIKAVVRNPK